MSTAPSTDTTADDPVLSAAKDVAWAQRRVDMEDRRFLRTRNPTLLDKAVRDRDELAQQMIETPARSLAGIRMKLAEVFDLDDAEPDLATWTVQHVLDDIERLLTAGAAIDSSPDRHG